MSANNFLLDGSQSNLQKTKVQKLFYLGGRDVLSDPNDSLLKV